MAAAAPALCIEPLSDQHDRESFASGVEPLGRYLRQQAGQDARRRVASCFVLVSDGDRVPIGYYTLAATSIALAELPELLKIKCESGSRRGHLSRRIQTKYEAAETTPTTLSPPIVPVTLTHLFSVIVTR